MVNRWGLIPNSLVPAGPFQLFAGEGYYPNGGAKDYQGTFDTLAEALAALDGMKHYDWAQISLTLWSRQVRSNSLQETATTPAEG